MKAGVEANQQGDYTEAVKQIRFALEEAEEFGEEDPRFAQSLNYLASLYLPQGRYDEAVACGRQACQLANSGYRLHVNLGASLAEAGHEVEARAAVERATRFEPALSIRFIQRHSGTMHEAVRKSLLDSLRKAGVPE